MGHGEMGMLGGAGPQYPLPQPAAAPTPPPLPQLPPPPLPSKPPPLPPLPSRQALPGVEVQQLKDEALKLTQELIKQGADNEQLAYVLYTKHGVFKDLSTFAPKVKVGDPDPQLSAKLKALVSDLRLYNEKAKVWTKNAEEAKQEFATKFTELDKLIGGFNPHSDDFAKWKLDCGNALSSCDSWISDRMTRGLLGKRDLGDVQLQLNIMRHRFEDASHNFGAIVAQKTPPAPRPASPPPLLNPADWGKTPIDQVKQKLSQQAPGTYAIVDHPQIPGGKQIFYVSGNASAGADKLRQIDAIPDGIHGIKVSVGNFNGNVNRLEDLLKDPQFSTRLATPLVAPQPAATTNLQRISAQIAGLSNSTPLEEYEKLYKELGGLIDKKSSVYQDTTAEMSVQTNLINAFNARIKPQLDGLRAKLNAISENTPLSPDEVMKPITDVCDDLKAKCPELAKRSDFVAFKDFEVDAKLIDLKKAKGRELDIFQFKGPGAEVKVAEQLSDRYRICQQGLNVAAGEGWDSVQPSKLTDIKGVAEGMRLGRANIDVGVAAAQGRRGNMEDEHIATVLTVNINGMPKEIPLFGVFDGHGSKAKEGNPCSKFIAQQLPNYLMERLPAALGNASPQEQDVAIHNLLSTAFVELGDRYRAQEGANTKAGTTANIVMVIDGNLWTANVGDTRAILSVSDNGQGGNAIALSDDAKPAKYQKELEDRGGAVGGDRVYVDQGNFGVARSIEGNKDTAKVISARANITKVPLSSLPNGQGKLILACDGMWDMESSNQVAKTVQESQGMNGEALAAKLVGKAHANGSADNISCVVVDLAPLVAQAKAGGPQRAVPPPPPPLPRMAPLPAAKPEIPSPAVSPRGAAVSPEAAAFVEKADWKSVHGLEVYRMNTMLTEAGQGAFAIQRSATYGETIIHYVRTYAEQEHQERRDIAQFVIREGNVYRRDSSNKETPLLDQGANLLKLQHLRSYFLIQIWLSDLGRRFQDHRHRSHLLRLHCPVFS